MNDLRIELILGTDLDKEYNASIETSMLDYSYVEKCKDIPTLKDILHVLLSGREGKFPHLEQTVVEKIISLLPERDRNKILDLTAKVSPQDIENHKDALHTWIDSLQKGFTSQSCSNQCEEMDFFPPDEQAKVSSTDTRYPPVRRVLKSNISSSALQVPKVASPKVSKKEIKIVDRDNSLKSQRISKEKLSNREYFKAWDKFDFDGEEQKVDDDNDDFDGNDKVEINKNTIQAPPQNEKWLCGLEKDKARTLKQLEEVRRDMKYMELSNTERMFMASREKDKGNDFFRNKEYENSYECYSKSLALDDGNAIVYANRAMVCIRLSNLCQAISDCTQALSIDPSYTKALARRGMIHHKCGRYSEAKKDFSICVNQEPTNEEYLMLLRRSTEREIEVNGDIMHQKNKKKIVVIQDDDSDSDESSGEEYIEEVYTPGARQ